jgi:NAD-dependent dihydropyrimidine dehydrogenase PreA subunit
MSFKVLVERCIGCGACDYSCHTEALTKTDEFLGLFTIDPYTCDDCAVCVDKCPERAIVPDPEWPVCHGHGCPLSSQRLVDITCLLWQQTCPTCGGTLWSTAGGEPACPRCDQGRKVACPKTRHLMVTS